MPVAHDVPNTSSGQVEHSSSQRPAVPVRGPSPFYNHGGRPPWQWQLTLCLTAHTIWTFRIVEILDL